MLRAIGYDRAAVLNGGWRAWTDNKRRTSAHPVIHAPTVLTPRPRPDAFADKSRVLDAIRRDEVAIVSALDDDLHARGVYGRPGRIPTSRCVPYYSLID